MGFDFGAFAGGMAQTGLDTYVKLKEQQRLRDEHEYMQKQRALQTALQDKLQASPKVGDANPNAEQTGGIPLSELAANNPGMFDPKAVQAGQYVQFNQAAPPPDAAAPAAAIPTGAPTPQAGAPVQTALPAASQPRYFAYADPNTGEMYATDKPATYDQDAVAMHQADLMVASGLPDFVARGQEMRNNVVQNRLVREQIQKAQYENSALQTQRAVSQAGLLFQQGNMEGGRKLLASTYDQYVPGPYKLQADAVEGQPDMIRMTHLDATGRPIFVEKPRPWKDIIAEASAMATPGGFADYLQKAKEMELQATELSARSRLWDAQYDQVRAALDAGLPQAEVDKVRAEADAAAKAAGANDEYRKALAAKAEEDAALSKLVRGLNEQIKSERNPSVLNDLIRRREAIQGRSQRSPITPTLDGTIFNADPVTGEQLIWSPKLRMFTPQGVNEDDILSLPEVKKGNIGYSKTPDGKFGYVVNSTGQMFERYDQAVKAMGQRPTTALPNPASDDD